MEMKFFTRSHVQGCSSVLEGAKIPSSVTQSRFEPYLSRLVRLTVPTKRGCQIDGTLVSLDISGFTSLSERLQAKGRAGAEELVLLISGVFEGLIGISIASAATSSSSAATRSDPLRRAGSRAPRLRATDMQWFIRRTGSTMTSVGSISLGMSCGVYGGCRFLSSMQDIASCW